MTIPNQLENEVTSQSQSHLSLQATDEVDVDSVIFADRESSFKTTTDATTQPLSSTIGSGVSTIMENLSPKDLATLASLLKPLLISQDERKQNPKGGDLEESALHPLRTPQETVGDEDKNAGKSEDEANEEQWHNPYTESTYSLFYLCSVNSAAFWYAFFVYAIQITTILLTLIDIVDWGGSGLDLPPNVDLIVTIAQGVALFQAIAFQSDLLEVVGKFKDGFHPEVLEKHPGATYATWLVSCIAQLIAALLLLLTIYILTMEVDSVLGIMLNFAALHFMADIDNVAFDLAKAGFMGNMLKNAASDVVHFQVRKRKRSEDQGILQRSWKSGVFLLILIGMVGGYVAIVVFRTSGKYMCNTMIVNMGDNFVPSLGTFNGLYDLDFSAGSGLEWRAEYVERRSVEIDAPGKGVFGYCNDIKAWTFRVQTRDNLEDSDPCDWIARSSNTDTYDITETGRIQWFVRDETNHEVVLEPFSLVCFDCSNEDVEGSNDCGGKGICSNAVCDCEDGWYGLRCEFVSPCPWITIHARTEKFASIRDWATGYQSIDLGNGTLVEAYHRPVYIHEYERGEYDVVMFTGGRWALAASKFLPSGGRIQASDLSDGQDDVGSDIGNFFKHSFHGYQGFSANFSVAFLSDYMEMGTHWSSSSPVGFSWYFAKTVKDQNQNQAIGNGISTEFVCHVCDESSNPCLYDGKCSAGECVCSLDSRGSLCEIPPVRNGHCDPFFNTPEFKMDGGDCCESTCQSTPEYICGAAERGYVNTGYYYCEQPKKRWQSSLLNGAAGSFSGYSLDLSMRSMVVSEHLQDRVRIYDKVERSWVLRETLIGSAGTWFGRTVALSSGPFHVVSNPSFKAPLTIAVQDSYGTIHIYKCIHSNCTQTQAIPLVLDFDLSDDGTVLAASLFVAANQAPKVIRFYEAQEGLFEFRADLNVTRNGTLADVISLSLSGDGSKLAVQSQVSGFDSETNFAVVTDVYIDVMAWDELSGGYATEIEFLFESVVNTMFPPLSMALNQDGTFLAYGYPNCQGAQLHLNFRNDEGVWMPRRAPQLNTTGCIDIEHPDRNNALSISDDGSRIAFRLGNKVRFYRWEATFKFWGSLGDDSPFTHYPVAISPDGKEVAIGSPEGGIGGVTTIYSLPGRKECPAGMSLLRLSLTHDSLPTGVVWNLVNNSTGEILFEQESYPLEYAYATMVEETCVPMDSCFVFTIYKEQNGGLHAPGQFALFMDGENVAQGTFSGLFRREQIGSCASCPTGTEPFSMMMLTCGPMEWTLLKLIGGGESGITLHSEDTFDRDYDDTVYETYNEHWMDQCVGPVFSLSYNECLDPTECHVVNVHSPNKNTAFLELVFGEQRVNARPSAVCDGEAFFVGQKDKCNQEADWLNRKLQRFAN
ncbi:expressed unknown protein [Seminavis robusta]|uniref:EGF-like domain-containing protein n=1 Tax=Seminavis robusta TaxID=568900 RepID=A0A9N8I055_9STRA|nr:expressed unknown protein [Seminavis robusta]|eukprot:Sro2520_g330150.1 n/a (1383) ;mRNA; f:1542-5935